VKRKWPVISLFTGAGGLDLGVLAAGGWPALCVEIDQDSVNTLKSNPQFEDSVLLQGDIRHLTGEMLLNAAKLGVGQVALVVGGPPCQPFSKAAYWTSTGEEARRRRGRNILALDEGDELLATSTNTIKRQGKARNPSEDFRSSLVDEFVRVIREVKPAGFVFENVMSITHPTSKHIFHKFLSDCQDSGYAVTVFKANAAEYGVPQLRKRVFVIGLRGSISPMTPLPTHGLVQEQLARSLFAAEQMMPPLLPPATASQAIKRYAGTEFAEPGEVIQGKWAQQLAEIPPGWNYKALTAWAGHSDPSFVAETRYWHFLLKLHPNMPSWTIAASPGPWTGPFHWDTRRLRIPELAALQTFPHGFKFAGTRRSIHRQIGNAVPALLAQRVIEAAVAPLGIRQRDSALISVG